MGLRRFGAFLSYEVPTVKVLDSSLEFLLKLAIYGLNQVWEAYVWYRY
jgi:hypothetical protein